MGKLGKGVVTDLRLSLDENKRPRGFGYVELKEESMVEGAIADLNGLDVGESHDTLHSRGYTDAHTLSDSGTVDLRLTFIPPIPSIPLISAL